MSTKVTTKESSSEKRMLTLEQIDAIDDRAPIEVPVSEWGGSVRVQALTLQQIDQCNKRAANDKRGGEVHVEKRNGWYLVEGLVEPKITLEVAEAWLTERNASPVSEILAVILDHSGLTGRSRDAAKSGTEG